MAGEGSPEVVIPLREDGELSVGPEGVQIGERLYALGSIQDARQVAPDPETIALRVAGTGLVEFQPARPGDGAVALEALFRLRPDLRPAGFEPAPTMPSSFPPPPMPPPGQPYAPPPMYPPYGAALPPPGDPPPMYPPPGHAPPPGYAPYGYPPPSGYFPLPRNPNQGTPQLTPVPRDFGQTLSAIFTLYGRHFGKWLLLALFVSLPSALVIGGSEVWFDAQLLGLDPTKGTSQLFDFSRVTTGQSVPFPTLNASDTLSVAAVGLGIFVVSLVLGAWQAAALSLGVRDALLGRPVLVARSLGGGLRRLPRTLLTYLLYSLILLGATFIVFLPLIVLVVTGTVAATAATSGSYSAFATSSLLALCGLCFGYLVALVVIVFLAVRIGMAPYATATAGWGPLEAIGRSWQLTRGNFWRTLGVLFIVGIIVAVAAAVAGQVASVSIIGAYLVAVPIVLALTAPLLVIAYTTLLYDLRLRSEGYAAVMAEGAAAQAGEGTPG